MPRVYICSVMIRRVGILWLVLLFICASATAQQASQRTAAQKLLEWRKSRMLTLMNDWGELSRYHEANAKLPPPVRGETRVVFFGDSITDLWNLAEYFPGKPYLNRGIGGQTTPQMLVRFRQDVIELKPRAVVILAGTNDIAGNTGPMTLEEIEGNYASIAELARAHDIRVIFSSVLPVHNYTPEAADFFATRSPEKILELNRWLKSYCSGARPQGSAKSSKRGRAEAETGCTYLDYFSAMVDEEGLLRRDLAQDGLHPNDKGYQIMAKLAAAAIDEALSRATWNKR